MSNTCHGCKGNGWVSPTGINAVLCPVCMGEGVYAKQKPIQPYTPYQPSPYFYGPTITCIQPYIPTTTCITSTTNVKTVKPEDIANEVMKKLGSTARRSFTLEDLNITR